MCQVDRPSVTEQRCDEVQSNLFDLFAHLGATDEQLDFTTLYASAREVSQASLLLYATSSAAFALSCVSCFTAPANCQYRPVNKGLCIMCELLHCTCHQSIKFCATCSFLKYTAKCMFTIVHPSLGCCPKGSGYSVDVPCLNCCKHSHTGCVLFIHMWRHNTEYI